MAMLLAMYQKMRLIREKNQATLDLTRFTSKYNRVSKNIERVQKMYTSKIASLESQAKIMMSQAKSIFQQQSGLAIVNNSAYLNPYQSGATNAFTAQRIQNYLRDGVALKYDAENGTVVASDNNELYNKFPNKDLLYQLYMNGRLTYEDIKGSDNKVDPNATEVIVKDTNGKEHKVSKAEYAIFQAIATQSQNDYFTATNWLNQANSNYETNVSIWLDAAKAQLEEEQDEAVEPLTYQQTMWELEKEQAEQKLERIKADLESYKRLCSEECKEQAPKFGLG